MRCRQTFSLNCFPHSVFFCNVIYIHSRIYLEKMILELKHRKQMRKLIDWSTPVKRCSYFLWVLIYEDVEFIWNAKKKSFQLHPVKSIGNLKYSMQKSSIRMKLIYISWMNLMKYFNFEWINHFKMFDLRNEFE